MLHFTREKIIATLVCVLLGVLMALPNVLPQRVLDVIPDWLPNQAVNLGLDLQGGSYILLQVDRRDLLAALVEQLQGDIRAKLREERIGYAGLNKGADQVTVRLRNAQDADRALEIVRKLAQPISTGVFGQVGTERDLQVSADGDRIVARLTPAGIDAKIRRATEQSREVIAKRIDELGTREPSIQPHGIDRIEVQVPGLQDPARLKGILGTTAKLQFRLLCEPDSESVNCERLPGKEDPNQTFQVQTSSAATVEGEDLKGAAAAFDQQTNEPIVTFSFNQRGALKFGKLTQDNVGKPFAIVLDKVVTSAPVIRQPILGGTGQISGNFTVQEANDLAIVLRSGALPAKLTIAEERTVGPSLGADSIESGKRAAIIGTIAVAVFMVFAYGLFGVFANLALAANIVMLFGLLSVMQATLTLPGIAGLVLTVGMAVDSNVLVFERIRDELREGRTPISAMEAGYTRALATIVDSQLTLFISALAMFFMGSGPIRGFAVTLALGIATSAFTAFTFTRLIMVAWLNLARPKVVPI